MKMIALQTVHGRQMTVPADARNPRSRAKFRDVVVAPGDEFDTSDLGIDDKEAEELIARKVAKRKVREVPVDSVEETTEKPAA